MTASLTGKLETILVVDDNPPLLAIIVAFLEHAHFLVLSAKDGAPPSNWLGKLKEESTCCLPTWTCRRCQVRI
jgi:CheY-like chemotaxis protein